MQRKRFTEEQIAFALRQAELGTAVTEITHTLKPIKVYAEKMESILPPDALDCLLGALATSPVHWPWSGFVNSINMPEDESISKIWTVLKFA